MQVEKVNNTNFGAGTVKLKRIEPNNISNYKAIEQLAKDCNINISIIKLDNKYLPKYDLFNVIAKDHSKKNEMQKYGLKCLLVNKKAPPEELSQKLYNKVLESVVALAETIKEHTGKLPDFIKKIATP